MEKNNFKKANVLQETINEINLKRDNICQIKEKLKRIDVYNVPEIEIKEDGSCLYRAVLVSF